MAQDAGKPSAATACQENLTKSGVRFLVEAPSRDRSQAICEIVDPVRLISVRSPNGKKQSVAFPDQPHISCMLANAVINFVTGPLNTIAVRRFNADIAAVRTGPGFECRPRNRQVGTKISSHGSGLALDIGEISMTGRKAFQVSPQAGAADLAFLAEFRKIACENFHTVLGPGSDGFHENHIHVDLEPRGKTGDVKYCR